MFHLLQAKFQIFKEYTGPEIPRKLWQFQGNLPALIFLKCQLVCNSRMNLDILKLLGNLSQRALNCALLLNSK